MQTTQASGGAEDHNYEKAQVASLVDVLDTVVSTADPGNAVQEELQVQTDAQALLRNIEHAQFNGSETILSQQGKAQFVNDVELQLGDQYLSPPSAQQWAAQEMESNSLREGTPIDMTSNDNQLASLIVTAVNNFAAPAGGMEKNIENQAGVFAREDDLIYGHGTDVGTEISKIEQQDGLQMALTPGNDPNWSSDLSHQEASMRSELEAGLTLPTNSSFDKHIVSQIRADETTYEESHADAVMTTAAMKSAFSGIEFADGLAYSKLQYSESDENDDSGIMEIQGNQQCDMISAIEFGQSLSEETRSQVYSSVAKAQEKFDTTYYATEMNAPAEQEAELAIEQQLGIHPKSGFDPPPDAS